MYKPKQWKGEAEEKMGRKESAGFGLWLNVRSEAEGGMRGDG